jgi:hypothetical protein
VQVLEVKEQSCCEEMAGAGVIGELDMPEGETEFLKRIKKTFEV